MDDRFREMEQQGNPVEVLPDRIRVYRPNGWIWDECDDGHCEGTGPAPGIDREVWRASLLERAAWPWWKRLWHTLREG